MQAAKTKRRANSNPNPTSALYYESLTFSNLKCFSGDHAVSLCDRDERPSLWTLLLGENGVGKTSVLQLLAWMRPVEPPATRKTIEPALFGESDNELFLKLVRQTEAATKLSVKATFAHRAGEVAKPVQTALFVKTAKGNPHAGAAKKLAAVERGKNSPAPAPKLPVIAYGANRQIGAQNLGDAVLADPVAMLFAPTTTLYDPEAILRDLDYATRMDKPGASDRRKQFLALIATIAPHIGDVSNIEFSGPSINAEGNDLTGIKFRNCFGLVPFSEMSLGQQTTIAWALDLAWRLVRLYPDSAKPLSEPAIVLVDEIDLHLHPKWQQNLRTYLTEHFPATQFIATAHSPLMAQASLDANLVVFQDKGGVISVWNDAERLLDWRLDQVVTALFGLPSARAPDIQALFDERDALLDTQKRNPAQEARLTELKGRIAGLSAPDVVADQAAMDIIRRAAIRIGQTPT